MPFKGSNYGSNRDFLAELRELIGDADTLTLIESFGGNSIYVADAAKDDGRIRSVLSETSVRRLSRYYGRNRLAIPLAKQWRAMHYAVDRDMTGGEIATRLTMTVSSVSRMLSRGGGPPPFDPSNVGADPI